MNCKVEANALSPSLRHSIFSCSPIESISLRKFSEYSALICLVKLNRVEICDIYALESTLYLKTTLRYVCVSAFCWIVIHAEHWNFKEQWYLCSRLEKHCLSRWKFHHGTNVLSFIFILKFSFRLLLSSIDWSCFKSRLKICLSKPRLTLATVFI